MNYVTITNRGEIPLHGIRLLGQSKKRDSQIGQFGTGLKEAIALCIRKGTELIIYSGTTKIEFSVQVVDGQNEVCFKYTPESDSRISQSFAPQSWHGMGFSPFLGRKDWTSMWQILREIVCNAIDEGDYNATFMSHPLGVPGETRVFLQNSSEIDTEMTKIMDWKIRPGLPTMHLETPGAVKQAMVFCKGVFIEEFLSLNALYHYNFNDLKVTESRTVALSDALKAIWTYLSTCTDVEYIQRLLANIQKRSDADKATRKYIEEEVAGYAIGGKLDETWVAQFKLMYGERAVIVYDDRYTESLKNRGYIPVVCTYNWVMILRAVGIPEGRGVLSDSERKGIEFVVCPKEAERDYKAVWRGLVNLGAIPKLEIMPRLAVFRQYIQDSTVVGEIREDGLDKIIAINVEFVGHKRFRQTCLWLITSMIAHSGENTHSHAEVLVKALDASMFGQG